VKKRILQISAGILAALLAASMPLYARYSDSISVINHLATGDVNIRISELEIENGEEVSYQNPKVILPGDRISKIPRIECLAEPCWVRAHVTFEGAQEGLPGLSEELIGGINEKNWVKAGDYYYCKKRLSRGKHVDLFRTITVPHDWNSEHADQAMKVTIRADAIQAAHFTPDFEAMSPWGNQEIELCVHEADGEPEIRTEHLKNTVEYSGDAHKLVAAPDDFFKNIGTLMPGDTVSDSVEIKNTVKRNAELFFQAGYENQTKEQLELLSALTIQIKYAGKEIYKGALTQDHLNKGISLGTFAPGQGGRMDFTITMPSALGNAYAKRDAAVKWIFKVEEDEEPTPAPSANPGSPNPGTGSGGGPSAETHSSGAEKTAPIKTGDDSAAGIFACTACISMVAVIFVVTKRRRRRES